MNRYEENWRPSSKIVKKVAILCYQEKSEINIKKRETHEKLFRKDSTYDYLIIINYNKNKTPHKGSAIFLHLTNNYKPTAGCIAIKKKDFEILLKIINNKTKIKIN